jgi:hypothetical protein
MNPLAPKAKQKKEIYAETYRKGTIATNREQLIAYVKRANHIFINKQAKYDDDSQMIQVTIDIDCETARKLDKGMQP